MFRGVSRVSAFCGQYDPPRIGRDVARLCASAPDRHRLPRLTPQPVGPLRPMGLRLARAPAARRAVARALAMASARLPAFAADDWRGDSRAGGCHCVFSLHRLSSPPVPAFPAGKIQSFTPLVAYARTLLLELRCGNSCARGACDFVNYWWREGVFYPFSR